MRVCVIPNRILHYNINLYFNAVPKLIYIVAVPTSMQSFILPRVGWLKDDFELVGICSPGEGHEEARAAGMRTVELPIARHISPWQDLKSLWRLWRVLRRERPDIVHSMTPKAGLLGMTAAFFAGVPVRMHTFTGLIFPWRQGLLRRILWATDALTCLFANVVNPEGKGVQRQLQEARVTRKPMHIIAQGNINGVDLERFVPGKGREDKRAELGFSPGDVVFTFAGRLVADKGIPELVAAFCRLHGEHANAKLVLIGREEADLDPLPEETKRLMRSHEAILCPGEQRDIERWLAGSDVYVLPSHREGFCNSLLEAGAMALPCITYDICGCNDSVDDETGILVPPYEHATLQEAMLRLLREPHTRRRMGEAARRRIEEKFDRRMVWQELRRFYQKILRS